MASVVGIEGLLPFVLMSLTTHFILCLRLPIFSIELFLLCAYTAIWSSRTPLHFAHLTIARRLQQGLAILPAVGVEVARAFYDHIMTSSFNALAWVLIWAPTTGLAMFARFALWFAVFTCTVCYFTATTPLKGLFWVPAWYCVVQPTYKLLERSTRILLSGAYRHALGPICCTLAAAGLSSMRSGKAVGTILVQHRPRLSLLVRCAAAVGAICAYLGRAVLSDICQAASEAVALYHWTTSAAGTCCTYAASRAYVRIVYTCCLPDHLARCAARCLKKSVIFLGNEPGTVECAVMCMTQFLEESKVASDALMLVFFASLAEGMLLLAGPFDRALAFTTAAIEVRRHVFVYGVR
ncbi:hypothetical protein BC628DRAFT_149681 [Trametes gibbosa]|nr:hypothetical protein BC628DRAFT_149681 [Trametes gibbosa]